jgi:hypothetical protein
MNWFRRDGRMEGGEKILQRPSFFAFASVKEGSLVVGTSFERGSGATIGFLLSLDIGEPWVGMQNVLCAVLRP